MDRLRFFAEQGGIVVLIYCVDHNRVMDKGRIVEERSHGVQLARDGLYASFWTRQSRGFLNPEDDQ